VTYLSGIVDPVSDDPSASSSRWGKSRLIRLRTSDGVEVVADLVVAAPAWAGAVVCHPHPAYGGDRHNAVVDRIFHTLAAAGVTVLRFDFRRGGDGGSSEQQDVLAGVQQVAEHLGPGLPLWLVGYSFGADIALSVGDERVAGWAAVTPPLRFGPPPWVGRAAVRDPRPILVVAAEHDQYSSPDRLRELTAGWPDATVTVARGADHFLVGAAGRVADTVLAWLRNQAVPPSVNVPPVRP
jgi:alpha/beta superfamily hydrolase